MVSVAVEGAGQLAAVGRRLKAAGRGDLTAAMYRGMRRQAEPAVRAVRDSAKTTLPRRGGYAELVASHHVYVRIRTGPRRVGMVVVAAGVDPRLDRQGRLRHPLFGDTDRWYEQKVRRGWFSRPMRKLAPQVRRAVFGEVDRLMRELDAETRRTTLAASGYVIGGWQ